MKRLRSACAALFLTACASAAPAPSPQQHFFSRLSALCGQAFAGRVVTNDAADAAFAGQPLVMQVRTCTADEIRIPFHVGDNRSRTWVITRTANGLRLKHDHRHEDGAPDAVTQYGGDTIDAGSDQRQDFPADAESKALFIANSIPVSVDNVWAIDVRPGLFAYELRRPNRHFRVEFDLSAPAAAPPPPWGG